MNAVPKLALVDEELLVVVNEKDELVAALRGGPNVECLVDDRVTVQVFLLGGRSSFVADEVTASSFCASA